MLHRWDRVTFLHWRFAPNIVQRLLPPGLTVETFGDAAWVGLVPFFMKVRIPHLPTVPWLLDFPETNVRTYVRGPDGVPGVWFFSLAASRLAVVLAARSTYRVPYDWSRMSVQGDRHTMRYESRRRWPGPRGARSLVEVDIGDVIEPAQVTAFDHYLTARWVLYGTWRRRLLMATAYHAPWQLYRADLATCEDELVQAAGLPANADAPVVHWSPGVDIRIGFPRRAY